MQIRLVNIVWTPAIGVICKFDSETTWETSGQCLWNFAIAVGFRSCSFMTSNPQHVRLKAVQHLDRSNGSACRDQWKIAFILMLAASSKPKHNSEYNWAFCEAEPFMFEKILLTSIVPPVLILLQNDLGPTLVFYGYYCGVIILMSRYNVENYLLQYFCSLAGIGSGIVYCGLQPWIFFVWTLVLKPTYPVLVILGFNLKSRFRWCSLSDWFKSMKAIGSAKIIW